MALANSDQNRCAIEVISTPLGFETDHNLQLKVNVHIPSPNHVLHDIITHNITKADIQKTKVE